MGGGNPSLPKLREEGTLRLPLLAPCLVLVQPRLPDKHEPGPASSPRDPEHGVGVGLAEGRTASPRGHGSVRPALHRYTDPPAGPCVPCPAPWGWG